MHTFFTSCVLSHFAKAAQDDNVAFTASKLVKLATMYAAALCGLVGERDSAGSRNNERLLSSKTSFLNKGRALLLFKEHQTRNQTNVPNQSKKVPLNTLFLAQNNIEEITQSRVVLD